MPTDELLPRARRLDFAALAQIHDRYYPEVYRYVRFRLDNQEVVEDITAEVFLRLLDALHNRRGPSRNLRGWLLGTASHMINDYLRARYAHPTDSLEEMNFELLEDGFHPEGAALESSERDRLRRAFQLLTPEQQHVLALRFADDRSLDETAGLMGKSVTAIKALQFRAVAALRKYFTEEPVQG